METSLTILSPKKHHKKSIRGLCSVCAVIPAQYRNSGYCRGCDGYSRPDGFPISTGVFIDLTTGLASHVHNLADCATQGLIQKSRTRVDWFATGQKPHPPAGLAYIYLDRFVRQYPQAADMEPLFKMYINIQEARTFARLVYQEQREKFLWRRAAWIQHKQRQKEATGQAPPVPSMTVREEETGQASSSSSSAINHMGSELHQDRSGSRKGKERAREDIGHGQGSTCGSKFSKGKSVLSASSDAECSTGSHRLVRSSRKRRRAISMSSSSSSSASERDQRKALTTAVTRPNARLPTPPESENGNNDTNDTSRASSPGSTSGGNDKSAARQSRTHPTSWHSLVTVQVQSHKPGGNPHTANSPVNSSTRPGQANHAIPLPRRMKERLSRIGYDTVEQLKDAGLLMTSDDLKALAKCLTGPELPDNTQGLDLVEEVAMQCK